MTPVTVDKIESKILNATKLWQFIKAQSSDKWLFMLNVLESTEWKSHVLCGTPVTLSSPSPWMVYYALQRSWYLHTSKACKLVEKKLWRTQNHGENSFRCRNRPYERKKGSRLKQPKLNEKKWFCDNTGNGMAGVGEDVTYFKCKTFGVRAWTIYKPE